MDGIGFGQYIHRDWLWYWQDEHGKWNEYAAVSSEHHMASITSQQLEERYLKNPKDVVKFSAGSHQYSLSFPDMIQTNLIHGTKRQVSRRPWFVSAAEVQTASTSSPPVHFGTMISGSDEVRPLPLNLVHPTDWLWYWQVEHDKWHEYAAVSSEHHMASITSQQLEERYLKNPKDVVKFSAGSHQYSLSFQDMIQTNLMHGTKRQVSRRPRFVSAADVQTARIHPTNFTSFPDYWDKTQIPQTGYQRVGLQPYTEEYQEIQQLFSQTMTNFNIVQIVRIQNQALWEAFSLQNIHMKNNNGRKPVLEKKLFHGTDPKFVDPICATNFDWRVCGVHGTSYGQGSYFARDASYSHWYTGTTEPRFMFVSRVLVGEFTVGSSEYRRPPSKDGGDVNLFDSCVDNIQNPSIFVVFEKHQIYPEYLLQYYSPKLF